MEIDTFFYFLIEFELIQKSSGLNNTNLNEEVFIIVRSLKNNEGNQQVFSQKYIILRFFSLIIILKFPFIKRFKRFKIIGFFL